MKNSMKRSGRDAALGLLLALFAVCLSLAVSACTKGGGELSVPAGFRMEDEILYWEEVGGADSYLVTIREQLSGGSEKTEEFRLKETSLDTFPLTVSPGAYFMSVMALGGGRFVDSLPTEEIEFVVETPQLLARSDEETGELSVHAASTSLKGKLVLPSSKDVTSILEEGFVGCNQITSVYIPDTISKIGAFAFRACTNLRRARLPQTPEFTTIPSNMFSDCVKLYDAPIPENVTAIGAGAFGHCESLKDIVLPANVTRLGSNPLYSDYPTPFSACTPDSITIAEDNPAFFLDGNCIMQREGNLLFEAFPGATIPQYTQAIGGGAFVYTTGVKTLDVPESVTQIEWKAFGLCDVEEVTIPGSVEEIDMYVLWQCKNLRRLTFKEGVRSLRLDSVSFSSIGLIEIPSTLTEMDYTALRGTDLREIRVAEGNPVFYSEGNCIMQREGTRLFKGGSNSIVPANTLAIGDYAFSDIENLIEIDIPASVKSIGNYAFGGCARLRHIRLPEGLEEVGEGAFAYCSSLDGVAIPDSVRFPGGTAFAASGYAACFLTDIYDDDTIFESKRHPGAMANYNFYQCTFGYDGVYPYVISAKGKDAYLCTKDNVLAMAGAPYRKGYTFAGWATEEGGDIVYEAVDTKGSIRLAAIYTKPGVREIPYIETSWRAVSFGDVKYTDNEAWIAFYKAFQELTLYAVWIPE